MSGTDPSDPTRYAADVLAVAGIGVDVETPQDGQDPRALVEQTVRSIAQAAPADWETIHAAFSIAGGTEIANGIVSTPGGPVRLPIAAAVMEPIRTHRLSTIGERGPWLCLRLDCDRAGTLQVAFDYGDTEIAPELLLPAEAYLRDFEEFRRPGAPLWLLAYMGNEGQQLRTAAQARAAVSAVGEPYRCGEEIPNFDQMWARFAVLSAVCRGADAPVGSRADPAFQVYVGDSGGCTLAKLPGNRAVFSGGSRDSRLLTAAYMGAVGWPDLYQDSPVWLYNLYLDPRAAKGLLSFCYWWNGGQWNRADRPEAGVLAREGDPWRPADEAAGAMPGVWTVETTVDLVGRILAVSGVQPSDENRYAAGELVRAAESRIVSEGHLRRLFVDGLPETFDIAEALAQLDAADVLLPYHRPIDQSTAKKLVVDFCRSAQGQTSDYDVEHLVATRLDTGWRIAPTIPEGEIGIDRTVFLVADDAVVEQVSSDMSPSETAFIFADRFARRIRGKYLA